MKYLLSFSKQLRFFREAHKLSSADVASFCNVDESVVSAWEDGTKSGARVYPTLENLLDICFKTGASLEYFLDVPSRAELPQLELPGLASSAVEDADLTESLSQLDKELDDALPSGKEVELLKRFRKADEQNRQLILQLMGL